MILYDSGDYRAMLGKISEEMVCASTTCIAQCTGCTCSCRCSCSGGRITDFEWEAI